MPGRPPAVPPAHEAQIRAWVAAGMTNDAMAAEAKRLEWSAKRTAIGKVAERIRGEGQAAAQKARGVAPAPAGDAAPTAGKVAELEARLEALEARLAEPLAKVDPEAALAQAVAALTAQLQATGQDPRAKAAVAMALVEVTKALRGYNGGDDDDDELFSA